MRHDADTLRAYLVADVEDPHLNVQSILSRHFLLRALTGERFAPLMAEECRFAVAMNWIMRLLQRSRDPEERALVLYALERGADNAEGIDIPHFISRIFATLPVAVCGLEVPNYVRAFLSGARVEPGKLEVEPPHLATFLELWSVALRLPGVATPDLPRRSILEPACGSANDYRALAACGLASLVDYTGFDLCPRNIENARALFPAAQFQVGNVFAIAAGDAAFDFCFAHDLFEHLSIEGLHTAVAEICRVTRWGCCLGFFSMDEMADHEVRPVEDYHWNCLSTARVRALFAERGFDAQILHIGTFLREQFGCDETHNPNAYTFCLSRNAR